ncbi:MAG: AlpA family phage regulatory protein [Candidatus Competibacteraceae bacterium]
MPSNPNRVLRKSEVIQLTGLSKGTIDNLVAAGEFPAPFPLTSRLNGWLESSVNNWIKNRTNQPMPRRPSPSKRQKESDHGEAA